MVQIPDTLVCCEVTVMHPRLDRAECGPSKLCGSGGQYGLCEGPLAWTVTEMASTAAITVLSTAAVSELLNTAVVRTLWSLLFCAAV